jgi:hypothetical protein
MGQSTLPQYIPRCWETLRAPLAKLLFAGNRRSEVVDVLTTGDINGGLGNQQGHYLRLCFTRRRYGGLSTTERVWVLICKSRLKVQSTPLGNQVITLVGGAAFVASEEMPSLASSW